MTKTELDQIAKSVRRRIFDFKTKTGTGHLATCLSCVDILVALYYNSGGNFEHTRDKLIFGKAHGSPALYPILADLGYFDPKELDKYCQWGGILRLHADHTIPGCNFVGGSLGNGIGFAAGLAYDNDINVFVILGDGELYEGSVWETLMFISQHKLKNMKIIVDRNGMCTIGHTEKMVKLEPLKNKFESFGFKTTEVDGHDVELLGSYFNHMPDDGPDVIIAKTTKGKGVSYMEGVWQYHGMIPKDKDLIAKGKEELI